MIIKGYLATIYILVFMCVAFVMLLNLAVALMADTYGVYSEKWNCLYLIDAIQTREIYGVSWNFNSLICPAFSHNIVPLLFLPLLYF